MKHFSKICIGIIFFIISVNKIAFCWDMSYHPKQKELIRGGEVLDIASNNSALSPKVVFLTFDDGPSYNNTPKVLNILNSNNVKATFFVIGRKVEANKKLIKQMGNSGMCILPHTYSHDYKSIYKNEEEYFKDLNQCISVIKDNTSMNAMNFIRLPGGADNEMGSASVLNSIKQKLQVQGIKYLDWNVSSMDAGNYYVNAKDIKKTVIKQCKYWDIPVILMHDSETKGSTVEALQDIITYLKNEGYTFKTLSDISEEELCRLKKYKILNK